MPPWIRSIIYFGVGAYESFAGFFTSFWTRLFEPFRLWVVYHVRGGAMILSRIHVGFLIAPRRSGRCWRWFWCSRGRALFWWDLGDPGGGQEQALLQAQGGWGAAAFVPQTGRNGIHLVGHGNGGSRVFFFCWDWQEELQKKLEELFMFGFL